MRVSGLWQGVCRDLCCSCRALRQRGVHRLGSLHMGGRLQGLVMFALHGKRARTIIAQRNAVDSGQALMLGGHHQRRGQVVAVLVGRAADVGIKLVHTGQRLRIHRMVGVLWIIQSGRDLQRRGMKRVQSSGPSDAIGLELVVTLKGFHGVPGMHAEIAVRLQRFAIGTHATERSKAGLKFVDRRAVSAAFESAAVLVLFCSHRGSLRRPCL